VQNYSINVQGGDDVANYNLSVGYAGAKATLKDNAFSRFNLRLNTDINVVKNVTVRFDASYSDVKRNLRDDGVKDHVTDGINSVAMTNTNSNDGSIGSFIYGTTLNIGTESVNAGGSVGNNNYGTVSSSWNSSTKTWTLTK
jgi:hypothetical protein